MIEECIWRKERSQTLLAPSFSSRRILIASSENCRFVLQHFLRCISQRGTSIGAQKPTRVSGDRIRPVSTSCDGSKKRERGGVERTDRYSVRLFPGGRQTTPYSPAPDSDYVLIEPRLRQPYAFGVDEISHTLWLSPKVAACRH